MYFPFHHLSRKLRCATCIEGFVSVDEHDENTVSGLTRRKSYLTIFNVQSNYEDLCQIDRARIWALNVDYGVCTAWTRSCGALRGRKCAIFK
jgi:hypothetical protein